MLVGVAAAAAQTLPQANRSIPSSLVASTNGNVSSWAIDPATGWMGIHTGVPQYPLDIALPMRLQQAFNVHNGAGMSGDLLVARTSGAPQWLSPQSALAPTLWTRSGNGATDPATDYLGTSDNADFVVRTNAVERLRILSTGPLVANANIGIFTTPTSTRRLAILLPTASNGRGITIDMNSAASNAIGITVDDVSNNNQIGLRISSRTSSMNPGTGIKIGTTNNNRMNRGLDALTTDFGVRGRALLTSGTGVIGISQPGIPDNDASYPAVLPGTGVHGIAQGSESTFSYVGVRGEAIANNTQESGSAIGIVGQASTASAGAHIAVGGSFGGFGTVRWAVVAHSGDVYLGGSGSSLPSNILGSANNSTTWIHNIRLGGEMRTNNSPGMVGDFLMSAGAGSPPQWQSAASMPLWAVGGNTLLSGTHTLGSLSPADISIVCAGEERLRISSNATVELRTAPSPHRLGSSGVGVFGSNLSIAPESGITFFAPTTATVLSQATVAYTAFRVSTNAESTVYVLPASDGAPGGRLSTDGNGVLSWECPYAELAVVANSVNAEAACRVFSVLSDDDGTDDQMALPAGGPPGTVVHITYQGSGGEVLLVNTSPAVSISQGGGATVVRTSTQWRVVGLY